MQMAHFPCPLPWQIILLTRVEPAAFSFHIGHWRILITEVGCSWKANLQVKALIKENSLKIPQSPHSSSASVPGCFCFLDNYKLDTKKKSLILDKHQ